VHLLLKPSKGKFNFGIFPFFPYASLVIKVAIAVKFLDNLSNAERIVGLGSAEIYYCFLSKGKKGCGL